MSFWGKILGRFRSDVRGDIRGDVRGDVDRGDRTPLPAIPAGTGLAELMRQDLAIVFKHSSSCPVSWAAHAQVSRFFQKHPEAPVRIVSVTRERPLSQQIAAATGIRHESPQILVLRRGEVVASASHGEINQERLNIMYQTAADSANCVGEASERLTNSSERLTQ